MDGAAEGLGWVNLMPHAASAHSSDGEGCTRVAAMGLSRLVYCMHVRARLVTDGGSRGVVIMARGEPS